MEFQTNPYLIWQLIPGVILLGIGFYIQSRPVKKKESNVFSTLMFAGSLWAFADAIQLSSPDLGWQKFWNSLRYMGIMTVPTAWFLISVKFTGILRKQVGRVERYLWIIPAVIYLFTATNWVHNLFFKSQTMVSVGSFSILENTYGLVFYLHTAYSYILILAGIGFIGYSLMTKFREYGVQAYGLLIGVLAPLAGNAFFLGSPPPGFPDPTPMMFSITGIAFSWAIFGGHILEVVPLAHETIVRKLSTGVLILDAEKNIRDINDAAREMLGLTQKAYAGESLTTLVDKNRLMAEAVNEAMEESIIKDQNLQIAFPDTKRTFDVHVVHLGDELNTTGWLIQFSDISGQKQTEDSLAATQSTLDSILNTLEDAYFEADINGVITYANRSFYRRLGYESADEVVGQHFRNFTDRQSVREIFGKFRQMYDLKKPLEPFEYYYRNKYGVTYIGEINVAPIMDGDQITSTRGLIRDVTDRVNAEKEMLKQKDTLYSLLQQSPIAMVINDTENKITMVNPAFEKLFGYMGYEVIGRRLDEFIPPLEDDTSAIVKTSNTSVVMSRSYVRKRKTKNGTILDVEIFNTPFYVGGERYGYLVFYNDITERLKAQSELEKSQSSYFAVLETLPDAYFEVSTDGKFIYVNPELCYWTQYSKEELLGNYFRIVVSRRSFRETALKYEEMFTTGKPIAPFDYIYRRKDGQELTGEMVASPIIEDGQVVGGRGLIRDISARVAAEEVTRQAKEAAEERASELAAINRLAETVSRSLDLKDILRSVCVELTSIFEIRNAGIGLLTPDKQNLEIIAFHAVDPDESSVLGMKLPLEGNTSALEVISNKKTIVIQDAQNDPRTDSISDLSRTRGTKSIMIVPLLARGEAIGTIGMPALNPDHIYTDNEIELAEIIAGQIASAVDNAQLYSKTESALGIAERDLEIGRQIQSGFFPETLPKIEGWEIATHFHAARQVAGDFYDVFKFKGSSFTAFIIADVCDKGVGAALFMVLFRSLLRAFSETIVNKDNVKEQLLSIIMNTNNFIAEYHGKSNMFATMFFGILDPDSSTLYYINGGHEPPVIMNQDGKIINRLMPTGPSVGMFPGLEFTVEQIKINEGDSLLGFTDGTTDAKNASGEQFTEERLLNAVAVPWSSIFSMIFELNTSLKQHIGEQSQFDDITLISFRRKAKDAASRHAICRRAELGVLGELREFVESAAKSSGLNGDDIFAFKLAVDELCTNIISYGFDEDKAGLISLFFDVEDGQARLQIKDDGKFFSPDQAKTPDINADLDDRATGGLGIFFVKELMDNVTYDRMDGNVNRYTLEKNLTSK